MQFDCDEIRATGGNLKYIVELDDLVNRKDDKTLPGFTEHLRSWDERISNLEAHFSEQSEQIRCILADIGLLRYKLEHATPKVASVSEESRGEVEELRGKATKNYIADIEQSWLINGKNHLDDTDAKYLNYHLQSDKVTEMLKLSRMWEDDHSEIQGLQDRLSKLEEDQQRGEAALCQHTLSRWDIEDVFVFGDIPQGIVGPHSSKDHAPTKSEENECRKKSTLPHGIANPTGDSPPGQESPTTDESGFFSHSEPVHVTRDHVVVFSYQLAESTYDASLFIFSRYFGLGVSTTLAVLSLVSCGMQIMICIIVEQTMIPQSSTHDGTLEGFSDWRAHVAGKLVHIDPVSGASLGSRVCDLDSHTSLEISTFQAGIVEQLHTYLDSSELTLNIAPGLLMCITAVFAWILDTVCELRSAMQFAIAVFQLEDRPLRIVLHRETREAVVVSVGSRRYAMAVLACIRILIGTVLGFSGVKWLCATPDVGDLLLNACALSFVFYFDELIFNAAAPDAVRSFLRTVRPLDIENSHWWHTYVGGWISPSQIIIFVAMACVCVFILPTEMNFRFDTLDALCKGFTEFVYEIDNSGMPYWAVTNPLSEARSTDMHSNMMWNIVKNPQSQSWNKLEEIKGSQMSLESFVEQSSATVAARWNAQCGDMFHPGKNHFQMEEVGTWQLHMMRQILRDESFNDCASVNASLCSNSAMKGIRSRQFCASTCGCQSALSTNPLAVLGAGCPSTCQHLDGYWDNPFVRNCTQMSDAELIVNPVWIGLLKATANMINQWPGEAATSSTKQYYLRIWRDLSLKGCEGLTNFRKRVGEPVWKDRQNLCYGIGVDNVFKGFAVWCPRTCACTEEWQLGCPSSCRTYNAHV